MRDLRHCILLQVQDFGREVKRRVMRR
jgi:hypothetical protein